MRVLFNMYKIWKKNWLILAPLFQHRSSRAQNFSKNLISTKFVLHVCKVCNCTCMDCTVRKGDKPKLEVAIQNHTPRGVVGLHIVTGNISNFVFSPGCQYFSAQYITLHLFCHLSKESHFHVPLTTLTNKTVHMWSEATKPPNGEY